MPRAPGSAPNSTSSSGRRSSSRRTGCRPRGGRCCCCSSLDCSRSRSGGGGRAGLQPGLHGRVLRVEIGQVGDQILDHRHVRQRIDADIAAAELVTGLGAGERVQAVDVHRARAADAFAARAAQRQRRIDLVFDLQQRIEHHRPAAGHVELVGIDARPRAGGRIEAIDPEAPHAAWRRRAPGSVLPARVSMREFGGSVNSAMVVLPVQRSSIGPRLGRDDFDLVGQRMQVHRPIVERAPALRHPPSTSCASAS